MTLSPHARLSGHKAAVIALQTILARTETGRELLLLSLDSAGRLCKWSLGDGRCLQSVSGTISSRPRGFKVIERGTDPKDAIQDSVIMVYGCSTEIVVLNAETLETVLLWTGNVDWPLLAIADGGHEILTLVSKRQIQGWVLEKRLPESKGLIAPISLEKDYNRQFIIEPRDSCGAIMGFERCSEVDYIVVQCRGVRIYVAENKSLVLRKTIDVTEGETDIAGYEIFEGKGLVFLWDGDGGVKIIERGQAGLWGIVGDVTSPKSIKDDEKVAVMAFTERKGSWAVAAFSHSKLDGKKRPGGLAIGVFSLKECGCDIQWNDNDEGVHVLISKYRTLLLIISLFPIIFHWNALTT